MAPHTNETRFRGVAAITLESGELAATFLPGVGMTGVSLRVDGREHLALPGGVAHLRAGGTGGLPLLAPWANRLAARRYRAAGVSVDLRSLPLATDGRGLPIHGFLAGVPGWRVDRADVHRGRPRVRASIDVDEPAFPFPHRIDLEVTAAGTELAIATTVTATGDRPVPIAFGWHPYLRLTGVPRRQWLLRLPARRHLALDDAGIPTGTETDEPAEVAPIGRRTFDDLYALDRDHALALQTADGRSIELRNDAHYPYAQVWVPARRPYAALEPMAAPTNALVAGSAPTVEPGESRTARFALRIS
jgi:galactose mutarotase-like enzyme